MLLVMMDSHSHINMPKRFSFTISKEIFFFQQYVGIVSLLFSAIHIMDSIMMIIMMIMMILIMMIISSDLEELSPSSPLLSADVFLLCFSIADHASLYTALDHWLPLLKVIIVMMVMANADNDEGDAH